MKLRVLGLEVLGCRKAWDSGVGSGFRVPHAQFPKIESFPAHFFVITYVRTYCLGFRV